MKVHICFNSLSYNEDCTICNVFRIGYNEFTNTLNIHYTDDDKKVKGSIRYNFNTIDNFYTDND